ncbi:hypothetical protein D3C86_2051360 [compost metagenome]
MLTSTAGGAMSGYWEIGSENKPNKPSMTMIIDITVDNTGLSINFFNIIVQYFVSILLYFFSATGFILVPSCKAPMPSVTT